MDNKSKNFLIFTIIGACVVGFLSFLQSYKDANPLSTQIEPMLVAAFGIVVMMVCGLVGVMVDEIIFCRCNKVTVYSFLLSGIGFISGMVFAVFI